MSAYFAHESSVIDPGACIGKGSRIWHWVHVCSGANIGENCSLGQNVFISDKVTIGNNVKIQNNVSVYEGVVLEDDVFCGPSMVFTNVINPRATVSRKEEYRQTTVKKGCTLGANCTVICGHVLGEYSFIAAGAVVACDVKPFALMMGVPAVQKGWMSRFGEKLDLPLEGNGQAVCPETGEVYELEDGCVKIVN